MFLLCIIFSGMILFFIDELTLGGFWGNILALGAGVASHYNGIISQGKETCCRPSFWKFLYCFNLSFLF